MSGDAQRGYVPSEREARLLNVVELQQRLIEFLLGRDARLSGSLKEREQEALFAALNAHGWRQDRAAYSLGISPRVLNHKMRALGIRPIDVQP